MPVSKSCFNFIENHGARLFQGKQEGNDEKVGGCQRAISFVKLSIGIIPAILIGTSALGCEKLYALAGRCCCCCKRDSAQSSSADKTTQQGKNVLVKENPLPGPLQQQQPPSPKQQQQPPEQQQPPSPKQQQPSEPQQQPSPKQQQPSESQQPPLPSPPSSPLPTPPASPPPPPTILSPPPSLPTPPSRPPTPLPLASTILPPPPPIPPPPQDKKISLKDLHNERKGRKPLTINVPIAKANAGYVLSPSPSPGIQAEAMQAREQRKKEANFFELVGIMVGQNLVQFNSDFDLKQILNKKIIQVNGKTTISRPRLGVVKELKEWLTNNGSKIKKLDFSKMSSDKMKELADAMGELQTYLINIETLKLPEDSA